MGSGRIEITQAPIHHIDLDPWECDGLQYRVKLRARVCVGAKPTGEIVPLHGRGEVFVMEADFGIFRCYVSTHKPRS